MHETIATHCGVCKLPDMVNTISKRCMCGISIPSYGLPGEKTAVCCQHCKTHDMINITCRRCKCEKAVRPLFGHVGDRRPSCCSECKEVNMVDMTHKRCQSGSCSIYSHYEKNYATYKVNSEWICASCCQRQHPEIAKRKLQMRSEILIIAEMERLVPELSSAYDTIWDCPANCSTRLAPDRVWYFEVNGHISTIHLEVDERGLQHEDGDVRVATIQDSLQSSTSWLVRFNPGRSSKGRPACVTRHDLANGDRYFEKASGPEWDHRMEILSKTIINLYNNIHQEIEPTQETWKTKLFF